MTTVEDRKALVQEVLEAYPAKAKKSRSKHLNVTEEGASDCGVKSNKKSVPGVMTTRGCAYAGAKGVVWGPVKDMIHISHGPVGCGYYSWSGRRNYYIGTTGVDTFGTMQFTSDFQERDIVFGGDKKLDKLIDELEVLFPLSKGTTIESECPVPVRCEGFRGVSQSLGHHIANDTVRDWVLPKADEYRQLPEGYEPGPYDVNIIGDYNIGGDAWPSRLLLEAIGLRVICQFSGDGTFNEVVMTPLAKMNLIHCYRSMNYICRFMEEKYQIPWLEYNFFGPTQIAKSLRKIAAQFDETIQAKAEEVIASFQPRMDAILDKYRARLEGKEVMMMVGGLRPRHVVPAFEDLGMKVIGTGYEFGHGDDYKRTADYVGEGTVIYDDVSGFEFEELAKKMKPDLIAAGIKEKYVFQKMALPFRQMHSWFYSGRFQAKYAFYALPATWIWRLTTPPGV